MNYLVSFADSRMFRSLLRLSKQADLLKFFDNTYFLDENNLSNDFKKKFKDKLILGSKGYGYWCWKPEIIMNILDKIENGDCLLYIDAGCYLNIHGKKRLLEYFNLLKLQDKGVIAFQAVEPNKENSNLKYDGRKLRNLKNYKWIKGDTLDYFNVRDNNFIINSQEIAGGIFLIKKCEKSIAIIKEWKKIIHTRFDLITDAPSTSPNLPGFIENRHDQTIWTLLCLKHNLKILSSYEFWYPKKNSKKIKPDWNALREFPIHVRRDKDFGLVNYLIRKFNKKIFQVKNIISKIGLIKKPIKSNHNI
jgi:hypothetical protein